ncbi:hypothetical protein D934_09285 [Xylella fastidiosa subsp. sandyi Ann-1]|uniref:Uncharacterized protein n=1 Tax=Xylella fastidiosa subsp. sandyi Ann-1 TaxID=155920 RepID=A0A060HEV1_XYLFS|nr:hypothetical protein D934_09285 [Xylella fastidiosa subsp. sandyi Ann-1]
MVLLIRGMRASHLQLFLMGLHQEVMTSIRMLQSLMTRGGGIPVRVLNRYL